MTLGSLCWYLARSIPLPVPRWLSPFLIWSLSGAEAFEVIEGAPFKMVGFLVDAVVLEARKHLQKLIYKY
jgi:hypothetical protein